ncbi:unnamed protein product, partial [Meganyctiphanes norvegica]
MDEMHHSIFQDILPEPGDSQVKVETNENAEESPVNNCPLQDSFQECKKETERENYADGGQNLQKDFEDLPEHSDVEKNSSINDPVLQNAASTKPEISESNTLLISNLLNNKKANYNVLRNDEMTYQCPVCVYKSKDKSHFKRHLNNHIALKSFECSECGYRCKRKDKLTTHMASHKGDIEKIFNCSVCSYKSSRRDHLTKHMQKHATNKDFNCSECGRLFKTEVSLTVHMKLHDGEKRCNMCDFECTLKSELKKHIRLVHEDGKPYQCKECGHRVKGPRLLELHVMRNHTHEKPVICEICGKTFVQNYNLQMHMRVHTGEKPFHCKLCPYRFPHEKDLKRHMMSHTKEKPYACHICDYKVTRKDKLVKHLEKHHNIEPITVANNDVITENNIFETSPNENSENIIQHFLPVKHQAMG